jgi:hypothetical protein
MHKVTNNRMAWGIGALLAGLLLIPVLQRSPGHHTSDRKAVTAADIRRLAARELPPGSSVDRVLRFLSSRQIEHSGYDRSEHSIPACVRLPTPRWQTVEAGIFVLF